MKSCELSVLEFLPGLLKKQIKVVHDKSFMGSFSNFFNSVMGFDTKYDTPPVHFEYLTLCTDFKS